MSKPVYRLPADVFERMMDVCGPFETITVLPEEREEIEIRDPFELPTLIKEH